MTRWAPDFGESRMAAMISNTWRAISPLARGTLVPDRIGEIEQADATRVPIEAMGVVSDQPVIQSLDPGLIGPARRFPIAIPDLAFEQIGAVHRIGIPDADRALLAIDLQSWRFRIPDIEDHGDRSDHA